MEKFIAELYDITVISERHIGPDHEKLGFRSQLVLWNGARSGSHAMAARGKASFIFNGAVPVAFIHRDGGDQVEPVGSEGMVREIFQQVLKGQFPSGVVLLLGI